MDVLNLNRNPAVKPLATMIAIAAVAAPAAAAQDRGKDRTEIEQRPKYEREYRQVRDKVVKRFSVRKAGRNLIRDGVEQKHGDVREARKGEVVESTELMQGWLAPAAPAAAVGEPATTTNSGGAAASSATAQCESGGDYGAVNPAGYYGAYQFDQGTWDSYAPEGYVGSNPASAPPAVQDAAAAAVPYDAWPNC